jgi:hypothetical protein
MTTIRQPARIMLGIPVVDSLVGVMGEPPFWPLLLNRVG